MSLSLRGDPRHFGSYFPAEISKNRICQQIFAQKIQFPGQVMRGEREVLPVPPPTSESDWN